ncbi:hypothetical protein Hanom_Chr11g01019501 [Helianthus anomalus]
MIPEKDRNYPLRVTRLPISTSMSLDEGLGADDDNPTDSGMSRSTFIDGPAIARLMSVSFSLLT